MKPKFLGLGIALVVIIAIAIGGYSYPNAPTQVIKEVFGATSSLDGVNSGYMRINGQREFRASVGMMATSSTVCAVQNPYNATTSIVAASAEVTSRGGITASGHNFYISTSSSAHASSTPALVSAYSMGTGQFSIEMAKNSATTSPVGAGNNTVLQGMSLTGSSNYILGPSEWVTWKIGTTTAGTFSSYMTGECSLVLKKV